MSGGSQIAYFFIFVVVALIMLLVFLYGSIVAYKVSKSKSSLGLLVGIIMVLMGLIFYSVAAIVFDYNNSDRTLFFSLFLNSGLLLLTVGIFLNAISFVFYVRNHNRLLKNTLAS